MCGRDHVRVRETSGAHHVSDELADWQWSQGVAHLGSDPAGQESRATRVAVTTTKTKTVPPWTDEEVAALNRWQANPRVHSFTCGTDSAHRVLVATRDGWVCRDCEYRQHWAHAFMLNML